jgi:hypothetical protein
MEVLTTKVWVSLASRSQYRSKERCDRFGGRLGGSRILPGGKPAIDNDIGDDPRERPSGSGQAILMNDLFLTSEKTR